MTYKDWLVFAALIISFSGLIAFCVYFINRIALLKQESFDQLVKIALRDNAIKLQKEEIERLGKYIKVRDNQGWNYVHGPGSGESTEVLQEDDRGRHHLPRSAAEPTRSFRYGGPGDSPVRGA